MSPFEIVMLICFGMAWPISIMKMLKTKRSEGKSRWFLLVVIFGYFSGIMHKLNFSYDGVIWLYVFNLIMVAFDLYLVCIYSKSSLDNVLVESSNE